MACLLQAAQPSQETPGGCCREKLGCNWRTPSRKQASGQSHPLRGVLQGKGRLRKASLYICLPPPGGPVITRATLFLNIGVPSLGFPPFPLEVNDPTVLPILGVPDREHPYKLPLMVSPYPSSDSATDPSCPEDGEVLSQAPASFKLRWCGSSTATMCCVRPNSALRLRGGQFQGKQNSTTPRRYRERRGGGRGPGPGEEERGREQRAKGAESGRFRGRGGGWSLPAASPRDCAFT